MKFFWKIFFTTMFISVICVALSGYILINSNFHIQLESEVKTAQDYGEIVYYSLAANFKHGKLNPFSTPEDGVIWAREAVSQIAQEISIDSMNQKIVFGMIDADQNTLFSSLDTQLDKTMISSLSDGKAGWTLQKKGDKIYIQTIRPAEYFDNTFYIETIHEVTPVFAHQKDQYHMMIKIMLGMILFAGALAFAISKLLLRPIVALTEITKTISDGNLGKRARVHGQDEISLLSQNFNQMADHLEEKIHELKEEADRKELFVGAFSHELKTPLTSIIGYSDLLRRKEMNAEQRHMCANYIFTEGMRLETLSMRLLDLIVLKKRTIHPEPVEIRTILDEVIAVITPQLTDSKIELIYDAEPAVISMEPELMKTVFLNLMDNARKAIETNGQIIICGDKRQTDYVITIRDTGNGMEKRELEKIADAFYMVDKSRARKYGGAGLGLAICDEILKLHGFSITFDSVINEGTTVTIILKEGIK